MKFPTSAIAITGMGITTALGKGVDANWTALISGQFARKHVSLFDVEECRCKEAAMVDLPPPLSTNKLSRASHLAIPAAREALQMAGLWDEEIAQCTRSSMSLSVATTAGGMEYGEQFLKHLLQGRTRGSMIARYQPQQQLADMQSALGLGGATTLIVNACAGSANAIGHAADLIRSGRESCVLAGGFEALTELVYVGFDCLQAMSPEGCRPFDIHRNGLMLGEGAGFLVLEDIAYAQARNAPIICYLTGYGHTTDLYHLTQPEPSGSALVRAMQAALAQSNLHASEIAYLNAHGTATPMNDGAETTAYLSIFGNRLPRISSSKAAIGHTLGAAGAVEAIYSILALIHAKAPPQIHTQTPLPEIASALAQKKESLFHSKHVMSVNLGFGGSNAALVFSKQTCSVPHRTPSLMTNKTDKQSRSDVVPMAICGSGAISPAGEGIEALLAQQSLHPKMMALLSNSDLSVPIFSTSLDGEAAARWKLHARFRRASPLSLFLAVAAEQALVSLSLKNRQRTGLVATFGTGCNIYSRRFFTDRVVKGRRFVSPLLFPETVFNSPTSHIASAFGLSGPCYSLLGDEAAWVDALSVAQTWLENGEVDYVLVLGAEELDVSAVEAYRAFGWLRANKSFRPSEGAAALLVSRVDESTQQIVRLSNVAFSYRTRKQAIQRLKSLASTFLEGDSIYQSASHTWMVPLAEKAFLSFEKVIDSLPYLGDAFVASAGWSMLRALHTLKSSQHLQITVPILGSNFAISHLTVEQKM